MRLLFLKASKMASWCVFELYGGSNFKKFKNCTSLPEICQKVENLGIFEFLGVILGNLSRNTDTTKLSTVR